MNVQEFSDLVFEHRKQYFAKNKITIYQNETKATDVRIVPGKKYTKIDVGPFSQWSGKFMIDADGNIFGIKAYGVIHRGHHFGTLDTVNNYFWGDYSPIKIN